MNILFWVLAGILLYTLIAMTLEARGLLPSSFNVSGPILTIHTKRGRDFLEWLSSPKRLWRAWGNFGLGIAIVVMFGSFLAVLLSAYGTLTEPDLAVGIRPQDALVIPGVNQFLPLEAAVHIIAGLVIGLVVHEGGHGLLCRVENIDIQSMGIALFALIPLGAFVQPDEESQRSADRGGKTRMFAAGVTNNFLVTVIAFVLLFALVGSFITVIPGLAVAGALPGSSADDAGIERGDVLTSVNNTTIENEDDFDAALADAGQIVTVDRHEDDPVSVERQLLVSRLVVDAPLERGNIIQEVDGVSVHTNQDFQQAIADAEMVTLGVKDTEQELSNVTIPIGTFSSTVLDDRPMDEAGAPDRPMLIHSIDGTPTPSPDVLIELLESIPPGEEVTVVAYVGDNDAMDPWQGDRQTFDIVTAPHPDHDGSQIGIGGIQQGTSGIVFDDFGVDAYPASEYHGILGGTAPSDDPITSFVLRIGAVLILPFANLVDPALGHNFPGFNTGIESFYDTSGPLSPFVVFGLANLLFWTGWINLNLGIFNCIPSYPLDGGHILRSCVEASLARIPIEATPTMAGIITVVISLIMIASVLGLLFLPLVY